MTTAAVQYRMVGRADSVEFAKAERVGQLTEAALPHVSFAVTALHPAQWEQDAELLARVGPGGGVYVWTSGDVGIGGAAELERELEHKYGIRWDVPDILCQAIAAENLAEVERAHRDQLDEQRMQHETAAALRGTAFREWMRRLRAMVGGEHARQARELCTTIRLVRASIMPLDQACKAHIAHASEKEEQSPKPTVEEPQTTVVEEQQPAPQPEEAQRPSSPPPMFVAPIIISITEPPVPAPPPLVLSEEAKQLIALTNLEAAFHQCKPFPTYAVHQLAEKLHDDEKHLGKPESLSTPKWLTWSSATAASYGYLEAQCREGEELRQRIARMISDLRAFLSQKLGSEEPLAATSSLDEIVPLCQQLCQQLSECVLSAARMHKAIIADARELSTAI
jgi:hypothetical protein